MESPDPKPDSLIAVRKKSRLMSMPVSRVTDELKDLFMSPVVAGIITTVLLIVCACAARGLELITNNTRPFTLFFLVPVAFGAAYFGVSGGLVCTAASIIIARVYLFAPGDHWYSLATIGDGVEMCALTFGTLIIALVTGRLRAVLSQLHKANRDLTDSENRRRSFNREVLLAVTGGVLQLSDDQELRDMVRGEPDIVKSLAEPIDASQFRRQILEEIKNRAITDLRIDDLGTAATEAATNAIKHGSGGTAYVWFRPENAAVLIEDDGGGISPSELARATLERGFSTRVSLGMGFYMMLESVDKIVLSTSDRGTSILLIVSGAEKSTVEQNILEHFSPTEY
jgi:anti-sigma regulatory factor (Ser/Thr protein kinase)